MVKQYSRSVISRTNTASTDKPLYTMPDWKCFCCQDTGCIMETSIRQYGLIPDYDPLKDRPVLCRKEGCNARWGLGELLLSQDATGQYLNVDGRIDPEDCEEIHSTNRQYWMATIMEWGKRKKQQAEQGNTQYDPLAVDQKKIYAGVTGMISALTMAPPPVQVDDESFASTILSTSNVIIEDESDSEEASIPADDFDDDW